MSQFGNRLKTSREKKKHYDPKWTQEYVASQVGVARSTYTAYEGGTKEPPIDTINKIADLLDVDADYLLGRTMFPRLKEGDNYLLDAIDLSDDQAVRKVMEHFVWNGQPASEDMVKDILQFARFRIQQGQR